MSAGTLIVAVLVLFVVLAVVFGVGAWLGSRPHRAAAKAELEGKAARAEVAHTAHVEEVAELSDEDLLDAIATTNARRK